MRLKLRYVFVCVLSLPRRGNLWVNGRASPRLHAEEPGGTSDRWNQGSLLVFAAMIQKCAAVFDHF